MIRVYVLDDHPVVRQGLKKILEEEPDIELAGEAGTYAELAVLLHEMKPDIIVLDLTLPDRSGLEILKDLKTAYPEIPVLILTIHKQEHFALRVLKTGAQGFLNKMSVSDELVAAVRKIVGGGRYISPEVAESLAKEVENPTGGLPHESLSDREFQVLRLIAGGMSVDDIAKMLSISPATVRTYRERLLEKMEMKSNVELTYYAVKNNLVE